MSSLTILLPAHNAQAALQANVQRVIEILPELAGRFEVLIVDDGSTDATSEVAYELARAYPQIVVVRHAHALGWTASVSQEVARARGDFVMIHGGGAIDPDDIAGLWRLRHGIGAAAASSSSTPHRSASKPEPAAKSRSPFFFLRPGRGKDVETKPAGALGVHAQAPRSNLLLIHRRQLGQLERSLATMPKTPWPAAPRRTRRHGPDRLPPPSFLNLVKRFAIGE